MVPWGGVGNDLPGGYPRGEKGTVKIDDPQPTNEQNVGPHRLDRISVHAQPPHNSRSVLVVRKHSDNLRSKVRCLKQCGLSYGSPRKREADRHFFFGGFAFSISLVDKVSTVRGDHFYSIVFRLFQTLANEGLVPNLLHIG